MHRHPHQARRRRRCTLRTSPDRDRSQIIAEAAQHAGAHVAHGVAVSELLRDRNGRVRGVLVGGPGNSPTPVQADLVIGADGIHSRIARLAGATVLRTISHAAAAIYGHWSGGPGWALVGDASYLRDPLTAQCVGDAARDAEYLARAILSADPDTLLHWHMDRDEQVTPLEITDGICSFEWTTAEVKAARRARPSDEHSGQGDPRAGRGRPQRASRPDQGRRVIQRGRGIPVAAPLKYRSTSAHPGRPKPGLPDNRMIHPGRPGGLLGEPARPNRGPAPDAPA